MALHLASKRSHAIRAATAFCPFVFLADPTTNAHQGTNAPPFDKIQVSPPTEEDWKNIKPEGLEISEAPFPDLNAQPTARNKWIVHIFKTGQWFHYLAPGPGDAAAIDPMTRINDQWPATMIVHGSEDNVPGRSVELVRRAEREMKQAGVREVRVEVVEGAGHVFDHSPEVGTSDLGRKWLAVVGGLEWMVSRT